MNINMRIGIMEIDIIRIERNSSLIYKINALYDKLSIRQFTHEVNFDTQDQSFI